MTSHEDQLKYISVRLDEDALRCVLVLSPGLVCDDTTTALCRSQLEDLGIVLSGDMETSIDVCIRQLELVPGAPSRVVIEGRPPVHGEDGWFEWAAGLNPNDAEDERDEEGSVDYYSRSKFVTVKAGTVIGHVHPPTPGVDGLSLLGLGIAARDGRPATARFDETLLVDAKGVVTAAVPGYINVSGQRIRIGQELDIHGSVDFGTGNVVFDGSAIIRGGIRDNFVVEVTEDLSVSGVAEAARIVVGRDAIFAGGIVGQDRADIRVGRHARARYARHAKVNIGRDFAVERELVNCDVIVGGQLEMPGGDLVGGRAHVLGAVRLSTLGSEGAIATTVHLGSSPSLAEALSRAEQERARVGERLESVVKESRTLETMPRLDNQMKERLTELSMTKLELEHRVGRLTELLDELGEHLSRIRSTTLSVQRTIYAGTRLVVDDVTAEINCALEGPITISAEEGRGLMVRDRHGSVMPLDRVARLKARAAA